MFAEIGYRWANLAITESWNQIVARIFTKTKKSNSYKPWRYHIWFKVLLYKKKTTQNVNCTRKKFRFEVFKVKFIFDTEKTVGYEIV